MTEHFKSKTMGKIVHMFDVTLRLTLLTLEKAAKENKWTFTLNKGGKQCNLFVNYNLSNDDLDL